MNGDEEITFIYNSSKQGLKLTIDVQRNEKEAKSVTKKKNEHRHTYAYKSVCNGLMDQVIKKHNQLEINIKRRNLDVVMGQ